MNNPTHNKYNKESADCQNALNDLNVDILLDRLESSIIKEKAKIALKFLPYYKPHKLAKIIGVSYQTIYNWIHDYGNELLEGGEKS